MERKDCREEPPWFKAQSLARSLAADRLGDSGFYFDVPLIQFCSKWQGAI